MTKFTTAIFNGIAPKITPRLLKDGLGQAVSNAYLGAGNFKPLRVTLDAAVDLTQGNGQPVKTLYLFDEQYWFTFTTEHHVVRGPISNDATIRTYFTGDTYPRITRNDIAIGGAHYPNLSYRLGVEAPTIAPSVKVNGAATSTDNTQEVSYVYTMVTSWGEEGPPSPPSIIETVDTGQTVELNITGDKPTGNPIFSAMRFYRLNVGDTGADFQFMAEVAYATNILNDTVPSGELGEVIPSTTWYPPPDETYSTGTLRGLLALPNGALAGFTGQELCLSVPYLPHAWPFEYRYPVGEDIVALANAEQGVLVLTDKYPYLALGTDPASMAPIRLNEPQACVSSRSVVSMKGGVFYASPDGLVVIQGNSVTVITTNLMRNEDWLALQPETIHAYAYNGIYIGFYGDRNSGAGFMFDPSAGKNAVISLDLYADAGYYDAAADVLYLNVNDALVKFDKGATFMSAVYRSKKFVTEFPTNMGALRVQAEAYPVTTRVWADGALVVDAAVANDRPLRLPSGYRSKVWEYEIETSTPVDQVDLASTVSELKQ